MKHLWVTGKETPEEREERHRRNQQVKDYRQEKLDRLKHGGAHDDVQLANIFLQFGIDLFKIPQNEQTPLLKKTLTDQRVERIPKPALKWLKKHYDITEVRNADGRLVIRFLDVPQGGKEMKLFNSIAEYSGQPRRVVKDVYEALIRTVKHELKHERRIALKGFVNLNVRFRPAKEKRKGRNPFNGKEMWFKARPASNKLGFRPSKDLKKFVMEKLEVVEPKKKHKKEKGKKHRRKKH